MPWQGLGNRLSTLQYQILSIFVWREHQCAIVCGCNGPDVDTPKNIHEKSTHSGDVHSWGRAKNIHLHMHQLERILVRMWHTKHGGFPQELMGLHSLSETKCEKCSGPSHEWSNRSILCLMAVSSPMDAVRLRTSLLSVCAHSRDLQCSGHCEFLFMRLCILENKFWGKIKLGCMSLPNMFQSKTFPKQYLKAHFCYLWNKVLLNYLDVPCQEYISVCHRFKQHW